MTTSIRCTGKCRARYTWNIPADDALATNDRCPECGGQLVKVEERP